MDISNIYDLSEERFTKYQENPFPDDEIRPGLKEFAKKFKEEIVALPTPHVMALEGGYGTGKTYFITRFCEYLKKSNFDDDEPIFSIYLNLWEHDYVADPFPVIASRIISSLNPGKELQQSIKEKAVKITKNAIKFGSKMFGGPDFSELFPDLDQDKKDLSEFKQEIRQEIQTMKFQMYDKFNTMQNQIDNIQNQMNVMQNQLNCIIELLKSNSK
jgi:Cdc6-like AAA superfamily ATPase